MCLGDRDVTYLFNPQHDCSVGLNHTRLFPVMPYERRSPIPLQDCRLTYIISMTMVPYSTIQSCPVGCCRSQLEGSLLFFATNLQ
jgi:hypothetical protein